jgi:hypothetical protein
LALLFSILFFNQERRSFQFWLLAYLKSRPKTTRKTSL